MRQVEKEELLQKLKFLDIVKVKLRNKEVRVQVLHPIKINENGVEYISFFLQRISKMMLTLNFKP